MAFINVLPSSILLLELIFFAPMPGLTAPSTNSVLSLLGSTAIPAALMPALIALTPGIAPMTEPTAPSTNSVLSLLCSTAVLAALMPALIALTPGIAPMTEPTTPFDAPSVFTAKILISL